MACRPYNTGRCLLLRLFNPSKLWGSLQFLILPAINEDLYHSKERQKNIIRDVMLKLDAGPRQLSRVSGLPYSIVYKLKKL